MKDLDKLLKELGMTDDDVCRYLACFVWTPHKSFGYCRPLFDEIERRGLQEKFATNLCVVMPVVDSISQVPAYNAIWRVLYHAQPADIVAAFVKTVGVEE